jgi:carboxypeptidase D
LVESRSVKDLKVEDPLIIWLRGEAGCSPSEFFFDEGGPYLYVKSNKDDYSDELVKNDMAWNNFANVMVIDLPIGSGYSYPNE